VPEIQILVQAAGFPFFPDSRVACLAQDHLHHIGKDFFTVLVGKAVACAC
jgi:hypothetical protein